MWNWDQLRDSSPGSLIMFTLKNRLIKIWSKTRDKLVAKCTFLSLLFRCTCQVGICINEICAWCCQEIEAESNSGIKIWKKTHSLQFDSYNLLNSLLYAEKNAQWHQCSLVLTVRNETEVGGRFLISWLYAGISFAIFILSMHSGFLDELF